MMSKLSDFGLLVLRLFAGGLMLTHGWQKLTNFNQMVEMFGNPIGIGTTPSVVLVIFAEFFCSIMLILGVLTRLASFPLFFTMLVAVFVAHGADPLEKKELPVLYMGCFLALMLLGGGKYALVKTKTLPLS